MLKASGAAALIIFYSEALFAQTQSNIINKTVETCVEFVHNTKLSREEEEIDRPFYKNFDVCYNSETQQVENSAHLVADQKPLFLFRKCMAEHGLPLGRAPAEK